MPPSKNPLASFLEKMTITDSCWEWTATKDRCGYGQMRYEKRMAMAHRVAYELFVGTIPDGMTLDHLCRNRACVNPEHLEVVDHRTNILRGTSPAALEAAQTHCLHGHPFAGENLIVSSDRRRCRTCKNAAERRRYAQVSEK